MDTQLEFDGMNSADSMKIELTIQDPETIAELLQHAQGPERDQFAALALRIGVLSISQAKGQIDQGLIRSESTRMIEQMHSHLGQYAESTHVRLRDLLASYFDPQSGMFLDRVESLLAKDGKLETLLERKIREHDTEISKTLADHMGKDSELMKTLDPQQTKGILFHFRSLLDQQLGDQRQKVLEQFSMDNKSSALSRLVDHLTKNQGELTGQLQDKIDEVVEQFSLDREESALSKLVKNVENAQKTITNEFSLDDRNSALARMKRELAELIAEIDERNRKFQEDIKVTLHSLAAKKAESRRSTRHGLEFEDAIYQWLQHEIATSGDVVQRLGNKTGLMRGRKIGDFVVELGPENIAAGAKIVIEAKQKEGYSLSDAREEIEDARKNRDAPIGLFIFSRRTAPENLEPLQRIGNDIYVTWDPEDAATDIFMTCGLTIARALCVKKRADRSSEVDLEMLEKAVLQVEKRTLKFDQMESWTETIRSNSQKLQKAISISRRDLLDQVEFLHRVLRQLKDNHSSASAKTTDARDLPV